MTLLFRWCQCDVINVKNFYEILRYLFQILAMPLESTLITAQIDNLLLMKELPAQSHNRNIKTSSDITCGQHNQQHYCYVFIDYPELHYIASMPALSRYLLAVFLLQLFWR